MVCFCKSVHLNLLVQSESQSESSISSAHKHPCALFYMFSSVLNDNVISVNDLILTNIHTNKKKILFFFLDILNFTFSKVSIN